MYTNALWSSRFFYVLVAFPGSQSEEANAVTSHEESTPVKTSDIFSRSNMFGSEKANK